jgi:hypothetical protein
MAVAFVTTTAYGCGPDPVGVEDCRQIEQARCEASSKCGVVRDVTACQRFYRDHCLHGFALEEAPSSRVVASCVDAIRAVGECARRGSDILVSECTEVAPPAISMTVCDAIAAPEELPACRFLIAAEPETPDAAGGTGGAGPDGSDDGAAGGTGGASGSAADGSPE